METTSKELEKKLETTSKELEKKLEITSNKLEELEKKLDHKLDEILKILKPEWESFIQLEQLNIVWISSFIDFRLIIFSFLCDSIYIRK